jgi:hypothetical protein
VMVAQSLIPTTCIFNYSQANTDGNKVYSEVDGFQVLLGYATQNAGCCKILLHPTWGSAVYPATAFAIGNRDVVLRVLRENLQKCNQG